MNTPNNKSMPPTRQTNVSYTYDPSEEHPIWVPPSLLLVQNPPSPMVEMDSVQYKNFMYTSILGLLDDYRVSGGPYTSSYVNVTYIMDHWHDDDESRGYPSDLSKVTLTRGSNAIDLDAEEDIPLSELMQELDADDSTHSSMPELISYDDLEFEEYN